MKEEKAWFASWFDTDYYHILYKNRNEDEAKVFITNLLNYLKLPKNSQCLDLACGKGRHARFLSENNLDVLGVDLSENSINLAKPLENEKLRFEVQDMRESFCTAKFDAVFNLFTSFGYFDHQEDNTKVLNAIHEMLKTDGKVVIDFMNAHKVVKNLVKKEIKTEKDIKFNITRSYDGSHIFKNIVFEADGQNHNYTERVQALYLDDFKKLLQKTGFTIEAVFGNFQLHPFEQDTSDRLILIARKSHKQ
jgi:2-polyprenyl-3-methyl-5-hydroxy-6-metoxy-1,4-benzoquinol methylase